jgi:hypothetical protein
MMTRKQYMDAHTQAYVDGAKSNKDPIFTKLHRDYYAQFVDANVLLLVEPLREKIIASKDEHLNDIPLKLWDNLTYALPGRVHAQLRECGDTLTLGTGVCILKEAARQLAEKAES